MNKKGFSIFEMTIALLVFFMINNLVFNNIRVQKKLQSKTKDRFFLYKTIMSINNIVKSDKTIFKNNKFKEKVELFYPELFSKKLYLKRYRFDYKIRKVKNNIYSLDMQFFSKNNKKVIKEEYLYEI